MKRRSRPRKSKEGHNFPGKSGSYAVIVSYGWCTDTSRCVNVNKTGLSPDPLAQNSSIYPNPTNGSFFIDLGSVYSNASVTITGMDGRIIQKKNIRNTRVIELQLTANPGIYLISITSENERAVFRIVKN